MRRRVLTALVVAKTAAACAPAGPAPPPAQVVESVAWGALQPRYDGTVRAWGKGSFQNRGNSQANTSGNYEDREADGNGAYVRTEFQFWKKPPTGDVTWVYETSRTTPEIGTAAGRKPIRDHNVNLRDDSSRARGAISVCSQFGWPVPDPCERALPSFNY